MAVTVGIPFYGRRDMLARCVRSMTQQTYRDLQILVIGDGVSPGLTTFDSRVQVYQLPSNRGAYFSRAVALAATTTSHHAVIDSDDWAEPEFLETLLATGDTAVQLQRFTEDDEHGQYLRVKNWQNHKLRPTAKFKHYAPHIGVYETQRLRDAGGYSPVYRMGYDTFLSAVLRLQGKVHTHPTLGYHRTIRPDSLSQTPETNIGSPVREKVRERLTEAYTAVYAARKRPERMLEIIHGMTPDEAWEEVEYHANRIRALG